MLEFSFVNIMRILQVIDSLGIGGAEKLIADTVPLMVKQGYIVDVLLLNGEHTAFYEELASKECCKIYSLGRSYYNPIYVFKIIKYFREYDIIHVHLFPAQYYTVIAKILSFSKIKLIFTEHNTGNSRMDNPRFRSLERFIYKGFSKIVCITQEVKNSLINKLKLNKDKLFVINNGINIQEISNAIPENRINFGYSECEKLLIMVAGFREQKDQDTVIKSLSMLPSNYKLILVGDGIRRENLQSLVQELNLQNRVNFLGIRTDVYRLIKMSDIAILSSHWEGFGLAAAEAMACGKPTIASNVGGLAQVVNNGGLLFEKGNSTDLKRQIISLEDINHYKLISNKCYEKSLEYDVTNMVNSLLDLYQSECKK